MSHNIIIVGLGPHCKRVYINGLKRFKLIPKLIVELESKRKQVEAFKREHRLSSLLFFIPDCERDANDLSKKTQNNLDRMLKEFDFTHAIISTEPKAHYAYLKYLITRKIPTLTDKPITAPINVINDESQANKIRLEYQELLSLAEKYNTRVVVQCQRRYDIRYKWIAELIRGFSQEYNIPVSHIQMSHCDGSWNMPDEFFSRENHPYKYGYGKLFHSGYHFIDLLNILLPYNMVSPEKRPNECAVSSMHYSPEDQLFALNEDFYKRIFPNVDYSKWYKHWKKNQYQDMGELDITALFEFSRDSHVITTCSLNLLQSGFTRRAWPCLPIDTYKNNGRVRHESISIHLGPLVNIQVHSYQAHEIKERNNSTIDHNTHGGLEHFDIYIYRNSELIGGAPLEIIRGKDLFEKKIKISEDFIGYNEHARINCLSDFLFTSGGNSLIQDQKLTIDLVTNAYLTMCRKRNRKQPFSKFSLANIIPTIKKEDKYDKAEFCGSVSG